MSKTVPVTVILKTPLNLLLPSIFACGAKNDQFELVDTHKLREGTILRLDGDDFGTVRKVWVEINKNNEVVRVVCMLIVSYEIIQDIIRMREWEWCP